MNDVADSLPSGDDATDGELSLGVAAGSVAAFGVLFAAVAWLLFDRDAAISTAAGAAIVALDVYVLGRVVRALFDPESGSSKPLWAFLGIAKLFLLFGGSWWLLSTGWVHALGLAAGIAALPLGLSVSAVSMSARAANRGRGSPASAEP